MVFNICVFSITLQIFILIERNSEALPLNIRDQVSKNTQNIFKLDQAQYKFINQLTKLQDDINDLEDEINKCKTTINRIQGFFENATSSNTNRVTRNHYYQRFREVLNNIYNNNNDGGLYYISSTEGFLWKLTSVSNFWNKTAVQLISESFYTDGNYGYKVRLKLDNPFGKLRVMLEILKGAFDNLLPWPFNNEIEVSLLSQDYPYKHYTKKTLYEPDTCLHRSLLSFKQYSHIYSMSLENYRYTNSKDSLEIRCLFNNNNDINDDKIFNRNIIWKIKGFYEKVKVKDPRVMNYSFYTGDFGYNLQLVLYPNELPDNGELNLFLTVLKGDFDDLLWWPFKYNVTIQILGKNSTKNMCSTENKVKTSKRPNSEVAGFIFFNKSEILNSYNSIIKDNQMFVKFKTQFRLSHILNSNSDSVGLIYKDIIWKITGCKKLMDNSLPLTSSIFQISNLGYNIQMTVYLNGERSTKGKHASLYIYVVNGSYDHILPWPFLKNMSLSVLNEKSETISAKISIVKNSDFSINFKPPYYHRILVAYSRFMALTKDWMEKYIKNDILTIKLQFFD